MRRFAIKPQGASWYMIMENVAEILMQKGIRPSVQRVRVLRYLLEKRNHPTVDTIYKDLSFDMPMLSRTTVYNTLSMLCANGLAITLDMGEGFIRYDADTLEHSHFRCKNCDMVFDLRISPAALLKEMPQGFLTDDLKLYAFGLCPKCSAKNQKN